MNRRSPDANAGGDDVQIPSDGEAARRRDEVLRRMLNTPPKPHKAGEEAKGEGGRAKVRRTPERPKKP